MINTIETTEITNSMDIIDSRDVIARIAYLESILLNDEGVLDADNEDADYRDQSAELRDLQALAEKAASYAADWAFGETLIRDSYFTDYAKETAEDCCEVPRDLSWPYTCIDWERAAQELQMDYSAVDFDGVTYWIR
jgi:hypothetical protein